MRLKLILSSDKEYIYLPIHYNSAVQGMLFKSLPNLLSKFLHDIGFFHNGRKFKLYTFSKINSPFKIFNDTKRIRFKTPITIYISSAIKEITKTLGETLIRKDYIKLGNNQLYLEGLEFLPSINISDHCIKIRTLSPITAYQTIEKNGKKFYKYYNPFEEEFQRLIKENVRKKYEIITGKRIDNLDFKIKPIHSNKTLIKYKNFIVEGYDGEYLIETEPEFFNTIYDAGLGAKNSQGFGMIEIIQEN
ncbi:MAG: CRISPR-associated endoribonuclease [Leptospiraceae bacterium]|nr:MAG: CRISPR-associated endoribonuclease [Leptospiraceae bacterium]